MSRKVGREVLDLDELGFDLSGTGLSKLDNSTLEGPEFFRYNKKDWSDPNVPEYGLMADQYMNGTGYLPWQQPILRILITRRIRGSYFQKVSIPLISLQSVMEQYSV